MSGWDPRIAIKNRFVESVLDDSLAFLLVEDVGRECKLFSVLRSIQSIPRVEPLLIIVNERNMCTVAVKRVGDKLRNLMIARLRGLAARTRCLQGFWFVLIGYVGIGCPNFQHAEINSLSPQF